VNAYGEQYLKAGIPQIVASLSVILPQLSFPGDPEPSKIHQRSWHEGPVTWGLFCRHQAWVGLSAGGRPIGKYRQWAMGFQPLGFPLFVGKLVFAQLMDFLPLHSFVAVSVLSIELSAKNFFHIWISFCAWRSHN